jgi:hypothetical protein
MLEHVIGGMLATRALDNMVHMHARLILGMW